MATLKQAQTNLNYTKIFSPIDGQVVARQYDIGQTVAASFSAPTLFTIAKDLTKMQVQADVDQSDIGQIKSGEPVQFTVDAYPEQQFRGQISQVRLNATVTQNVITYPVIIEVPNPEGKLRPSMTANVTIQVDTVRDVLRVPNSALRFRPETAPGQQASGGGRSGGSRPGGSAGGGSGAGGSFQQRAGGGGGGQAGQTAGQAGDGSGGGRGSRRQPGQTVYVLNQGEDKKSQLRQVRIATGITDGRYTQVTKVLSGELNPGDPVVTGVATVKVEGVAGQPNPLGGGRGGGGGGGGRRPF
jgi:HlyD family secretion protein